MSKIIDFESAQASHRLYRPKEPGYNPYIDGDFYLDKDAFLALVGGLKMMRVYDIKPTVESVSEYTGLEIAAVQNWWDVLEESGILPVVIEPVAIERAIPLTQYVEPDLYVPSLSDYYEFHEPKKHVPLTERGEFDPMDEMDKEEQEFGYDYEYHFGGSGYHNDPPCTLSDAELQALDKFIADLPEMSSIPKKMPEDELEEIQEHRRNIFRYMDPLNREYFRSWTNFNFWKNCLMIPERNDYIFDKMRLTYSHPKTTDLQFQRAIERKISGELPGLRVAYHTHANLIWRGEAIREQFLCLSVRTKAIGKVFAEVLDAAFWMAAKDLSESHVVNAYANIVNKQTKRSLPQIFGDTAGRVAFAESLRNGKMMFMDAERFLAYQGQANALFWIANKEATVADFDQNFNRYPEGTLDWKHFDPNCLRPGKKFGLWMDNPEIFDEWEKTKTKRGFFDYR